jgi:uncharacterized Zn finger protein
MYREPEYSESEDRGQYKDFIATRLYCSNCRVSSEVIERLLLILPDGYLYEYLCKNCGEVLGDKKVSLNKKDKILF